MCVSIFQVPIVLAQNRADWLQCSCSPLYRASETQPALPSEKTKKNKAPEQPADGKWQQEDGETSSKKSSEEKMSFSKESEENGWLAIYAEPLTCPRAGYVQGNRLKPVIRSLDKQESSLYRILTGTQVFTDKWQIIKSRRYCHRWMECPLWFQNREFFTPNRYIRATIDSDEFNKDSLILTKILTLLIPLLVFFRCSSEQHEETVTVSSSCGPHILLFKLILDLNQNWKRNVCMYLQLLRYQSELLC